MKKIILVSLTAALAFPLLMTGCGFFVKAAEEVEGSGTIETRQYDFTDFSKVDIGAAFEYEISDSGAYGVSVTADKNFFDYIRVEKTGDTLKINSKPVLFIGRKTIKVIIEMPSLSVLKASGATDGAVSGFSSGEDLYVVVSGASTLEMESISAGDVDVRASGSSRIEGELEATDIVLDISGASRVELAGSAANTEIKASGSSRIILDEFQAADTTIALTGASDIIGGLSATDVKVDASGSSQVDLTGGARDMELVASGASWLDLDSFPARNASVVLGGSSRADVYLNGRLDIDLSGGSNLWFSGEPTIGDIHISSGSSLERKS